MWWKNRERYRGIDRESVRETEMEAERDWKRQRETVDRLLFSLIFLN